MKKVIYCFLIFIFIVKCSSKNNNEKLESISDKFNEINQVDGFSKKEIDSISDSIKEMIHFEEKIQSIQNNFKKKNEKLKMGADLYNDATQFIQSNPEHEQIELVYILAARGAEANERYDNAITYYYQAQRKFPKSPKAAEYLKSRAIILDFVLNRKKAAILAHEELIELYPDHPLAKDSKYYLERNLTDLPASISSEELEKILKNKD